MSNEFKARNGLITPKAKLTPASGDSALNITTSAPSSPISGDIWAETSGLYAKNSNVSIVGSRGNSPGVLSQPTITITGSGSTFNASSVDVVLFSQTGWAGDFKTYTVPAVTGLTLTDQSANYLVVSYNSGNPVYSVVTDVSLIDNSSIVGASLLWRNGTQVHYQPIDWGRSTASRLNRRLVQTNRYQWASGLALGESTGNVITVGAGVIWYGVTQYSETLQTSASSNAEFWHHSSGNWTSSAVSTYNNTQYDNGTNLVTLSGAGTQYAVNWVYRYIDESGMPKLAYIMGSGNYNLSSAIASTSPTPPPILSTMAILVGRIIVAQGASTATQIDSAFSSQFAGSIVTDHNSLNNLQGGDVSEYYHLSNAQYVIATQAATASVSGYLSSADWSTFNSKLSGTSGSSILAGNGSGGLANVTIGTGLSFVGGTLSAVAAGVGTVTSVGLSLPTIFTVSGSPVTTAGTLSATLASQSANQFFAAPNGSAGAPGFRSIVAADIPTLNQNTTGSAGSVANALTIGTGLSGTSYNGSAAVTIAIDSTVATLTGTQTLTGKTISGALNTLTNIGNGSLTNSSISINGSAISLGGSISGLALTTGTLAQFASTTSAQLLSVISDETGTGSLVFGTSPTISTSLITGSTSFDLINTNALTVNFAKAATVLSIGATTGTTTINNNVVISGNLTVNGTTETINSTIVQVADINITLGATASPTDATADGGGFTLKGTIDKTFNWVNATSAWTSSENLNLATGKTYFINGTSVLSGTTLGSGVTASSLTAVGTITTGTWSGLFGAVSGANLTSLTAGNLTGTISSTVLGNSTVYIGTTAVALNRASANLALTGILSETYSGATSGTIQVIPAAIAGTGTVITLPATTGTVVTSGDTGTVSNTMLAGSIANSKLLNSTISGVALGSNLNVLTIGTGLSGTSYNGSAAVTIAIDSTVATLTGTQTLTGKTISGALNTLTNIGNGSLTNSSISINGSAISLGGSISGLALTTGTLAQFASTTSAQLLSVISDETGTGSLVFGTSPTISTSLITGSTSFDLINTNALTVNFAKAATVLSIGATTGTTTINNNVVISGNLTVNGTTETINSTIVQVADINITLGATASPTDATADGGGFTLKGTIDKTFNWVNATSAWTSSENLNLATGKTYFINGTSVLSGTTLGSGVTASSLTAVGTITTGTWSGLFGAVSGANLTSLTAGNLTGTISSTVLGNSTVYIGTTAVALNRASANLALTGILSETYSGATSGTIQVIPAAIAGTGTVITLPATTGTVVTSGDTGTVSNTMLAGSIANSKLLNSTISGVALGSNLNVLTIGTGLSGTSYNGSAGVTIAIDSTVATLTGIQTLTNKTISGSTNTLSNIGNSSLTNSSITINGSATSLGGSINVGTVTSVAALTLGTTGTDVSSTIATGTTTPVITLNIPTASATNRGALSSTDWSTFNGKQATLVSGTNIKTVGGVSLLGSGDLGVIGVSYLGTGTPSTSTFLRGDGTWTSVSLPAGQTSGSATTGYLQYAGTTSTAGQLDGGTTAPSNTTRLNYNGNLYATNFFGSGSGLTSIPNSALTNSSITFGSTAVALGSTVTGLTIGNYNATATITSAVNQAPFNYGTLSFTDTNIFASMQSSVNSYNQFAIQNTNSGTAASAGYVAYNDNGTPTSNYMTMGINSSGYTGAGSINAAGYGYLLSASTDMVIGTIGANGIHFTVNSGATDALAISSAGVVSLGTALGAASGGTGLTSPGTSGNILVSNGSAWISQAPTGGGASITDDTSTNVTQYLTSARITSGTWSTAYTASTKLYFNPSSGALSSIAFTSLSDINFKKNVKVIDNATGTINRLEGVEFDWKDTGKHSYGVIAQKLEEILPELVETNEKGIKTVNYAGITGFLINAIKEMDARIKKLESK